MHKDINWRRELAEFVVGIEVFEMKDDTASDNWYIIFESGRAYREPVVPIRLADLPRFSETENDALVFDFCDDHPTNPETPSNRKDA